METESATSQLVRMPRSEEDKTARHPVAELEEKALAPDGASVYHDSEMSDHKTMPHISEKAAAKRGSEEDLADAASTHDVTVPDLTKVGGNVISKSWENWMAMGPVRIRPKSRALVPSIKYTPPNAKLFVEAVDLTLDAINRPTSWTRHWRVRRTDLPRGSETMFGLDYTSDFDGDFLELLTDLQNMLLANGYEFDNLVPHWETFERDGTERDVDEAFEVAQCLTMEAAVWGELFSQGTDSTEGRVAAMQILRKMRSASDRYVPQERRPIWEEGPLPLPAMERGIDTPNLTPIKHEPAVSTVPTTSPRGAISEESSSPRRQAAPRQAKKSKPKRENAASPSTPTTTPPIQPPASATPQRGRSQLNLSQVSSESETQMRQPTRQHTTRGTTRQNRGYQFNRPRVPPGSGTRVQPPTRSAAASGAAGSTGVDRFDPPPRPAEASNRVPTVPRLATPSAIGDASADDSDDDWSGIAEGLNMRSSGFARPSNFYGYVPMDALDNFDGKSATADNRRWMEKFLYLYGGPAFDDAGRLLAFRMRLDGVAKSWYNALPISKKRLWSTVQKAFCEQFCTHVGSAAERYYQLHQAPTETPEDHLLRLNELATKASIDVRSPKGLRAHVTRFIKSLRDHEFRAPLQGREFSSIDDLVRAVKLLEEQRGSDSSDRKSRAERRARRDEQMYRIESMVAQALSTQGTSQPRQPEADGDYDYRSDGSDASDAEERLIYRVQEALGKTRDPCTKCGTPGHSADFCWSDRTCGECGEKGHISRVCRTLPCDVCLQKHKRGNCPMRGVIEKLRDWNKAGGDVTKFPSNVLQHLN